jgi:DNA-binding transcriptional MerR regulator
MRISELSRATGVPIATIKYYLREGLLPAGEATAANQARYDDRHRHRLRLIRTLREVGGLGIDTIRAVLDAVDDEGRSLHQVLGVAHRALAPAPATADPVAQEDVDELLDHLGWRIGPGSPDRVTLAAALTSLRQLGWEVEASTFVPHARAADELAEVEVGSMAGARSRTAAVEHAVIGTVVYGTALAALRRLAHEHRSAGLDIHRSAAGRAAGTPAP